MFIVWLFLAAQLGGPECKEIISGPAEGLCADQELERFGDLAVMSVKPGKTAPPPLEPKLARIIDRLLAARGSTIPADMLAPDATSTFCTTMSKECLKTSPLRALPPLSSEYAPGAPWQLDDGQIRVGWLKNGKLEYLSMIKLGGGKVRSIRSAPATIPVKGR